MINMHDIPGIHDEWIGLGGFGTADDASEAVVFVAPWKCNLMQIDAWYGSAIAGGTASGSACFGIIASYGTADNSTAAFGTANSAGGSAGGVTRVHGDALAIYSGTKAMVDGAYVTLTYDAAFGSANALAAPRCLVHVRYEGR